MMGAHKQAWSTDVSQKNRRELRPACHGGHQYRDDINFSSSDCRDELP
jgi:hypothetical protein